jgi:hypothetical protein
MKLNRLERIDFLLLILALSIGFYYLGLTDWRYPIIHDDNPCVFFELWYSLKVAIPQIGDMFTWNPYWSAGIPFMQFYPPGFLFIGIFLNIITLHLLSVENIYFLLILFTYFLPGVSTFLLYKKLSLSRTSTFFAVLVMLLYHVVILDSMFLGADIGGMAIGMLSNRIAIGLFPLAIYFAIECFQRHGRLRDVVLTGLTLCMIYLTHPMHSILPTLGIFFVWLFNHRSLQKGFTVFSIAIGTSAFWILPLIQKSSCLQIGFMWPFSLQHLRVWIEILSPYLILYALSINWVFKHASLYQKKVVLPLICLAPAMLLFVIFNYLILFKHLNIEFFDAFRLNDSFFYPVLLVSGIGLEAIIGWIHKDTKAQSTEKAEGAEEHEANSIEHENMCTNLPEIIPQNTNRCILWQRRALYAIIVGIVFYTILDPLIADLPKKSPYRACNYKDMTDEFELDKLWKILQDRPDGRILPTTPVVQYLNYSGCHTHIWAMAPIFTKKEVIGCTAGLPIGNYYIYGEKQKILTHMPESCKGYSLFGMSYKDELTEEKLYNICCRLNIKTIVATDQEPNALLFFKKSRLFTLTHQVGIFFIFDVTGYHSSLIDADSVSSQVISYKPDRIKIRVHDAKESTEAILKVSYYPLWHAYINGKPLQLTMDDIGLIKFIIPKGKDYTIVFKYKKGLVEHIGMIITFITLIGILSAFLWKGIVCLKTKGEK